MRVGCGKAAITPQLGLPMLGMPGSPRGEGVFAPLHSRVFLADDGERRIAVVALDLIALSPEAAAALRQRLGERGGLPPDHVLIACSHTHRAPYVTPDADDPPLPGADEGTVQAYLDLVFTRTATAMDDALAALQPAELVVGRAQTSGWAFNRRPIYANGEVGTHGWAWQEGFVRMEETPDEELWTLLARTPDGETIGGLVGFACHPTAMGHEPVYSADYPGVLTAHLEARHGGVIGFLLGAAGDTSTPDPTSRDPESGFGVAHTEAMGAALAEAAEQALKGARSVTADRLRIATTRLNIAQRQPTPQQLALARWYLDERPPDLDEQEFTRRLSGHDYTFNDGVQIGNERHAQEMLRMAAWQQGADAQLVEEIELQALLLGDVALATFPAEMFTALGRKVQAVSPLPDTFIVTLANGWHGYVPTREAFSRGGYEPRFAFPSRLAEEAGARMTDAAAGLLRAVAE